MRHSRSALAKGTMLATLLLFSPAVAEEALPRFDAKDMVPLVHGPNWVDLDGDGHKDLVMKSRIAINSPHSLSLYSFHIWAKAKPHGTDGQGDELLEPEINWYAVSFPEREPPLGTFSVSTHQGADCLLRDYRLIVHREKGRKINAVLLIEAQRDSGESYADRAPVTFTVYHLEKGSVKALNEFAFIKAGEFKAAKPYCSVINAFNDELGLPGGDPAFADYTYEPGK